MNIDLKNRQQLLAILAAGAVGLLAADRLIVQPLISAWKNRSGEIAKLRESYVRGNQLLNRAQVIQSWWDVRRPHVLTNDPSAAQAQLCSAIDRWAQESRATVTSVKPAWKRLEGDAAVIECRIDSSGDLQSITRFLYNLESDPMALRIQDLDLTARDDNGQQITLALQVSGLVLNPKQTQ